MSTRNLDKENQGLIKTEDTLQILSQIVIRLCSSFHLFFVPFVSSKKDSVFFMVVWQERE